MKKSKHKYSNALNLLNILVDNMVHVSVVQPLGSLPNQGLQLTATATHCARVAFCILASRKRSEFENENMVSTEWILLLCYQKERKEKSYIKSYIGEIFHNLKTGSWPVIYIGAVPSYIGIVSSLGWSSPDPALWLWPRKVTLHPPGCSWLKISSALAVGDHLVSEAANRLCFSLSLLSL